LSTKRLNKLVACDALTTLQTVEKRPKPLEIDFEIPFDLERFFVLNARHNCYLMTMGCPLQVVVHITDENDCTPEFLHSIYTRDNIPESVTPGTSLLQGNTHTTLWSILWKLFAFNQ